MSESVQHAGSARHSTTGDVYCMRAVPVTPRQVMFTVYGQCPSLHAEGLRLYARTETVGTLAIKSGKFKTQKISVNKNYSLTSISELKNHEFTNY